MFCKECGAEIPDDSKHCKECGAKLIEDTSNIDNEEIVSIDNNAITSTKTKSNIIYDIDAPEVKEAIANGAKLNYLGKEKIHSQLVRIITVLLGFIIGSIIFPIIGTIIGVAIGYWICKEERDMYFLEYPND